MKIAMVGAGYVGLVSGACFSDFGHHVTCVDTNAERVQRLKQGEVPIFEPGLDVLLQRNITAGRLSFTTGLDEAICSASAIFIAVGTPSRHGDGHADLSYVMKAAEDIARLVTDYAVLVIKSTVPVGTNRKVAEVVRKANPAARIDVVSNPEFLREGSAIEDFMRPDRVLVGVETEAARAVLGQIYRPLYLREFPIIYTGIESAEITKYAANAFLAMKISFINEIAYLCEKAGGDVKDVAKAIGLDGRIGNKFLNAGPGFGGSCFPKDTRALIRIGEDFGSPMRLTEAVITVNDAVKHRMADKIDAMCGGLMGKTVAVLGVTFKPNTDDMREAAALVVVPEIMRRGADVRVADPQGRKEGEGLLPGVMWIEDPYLASEGADVLVLLTEWNEYRALDLKRLAASMRSPRMADLRNVYSRADAEAAGFQSYVGVGR